MDELIRKAKHDGEYDLGIAELKGMKVIMDKQPMTVYRDPDTGTKTFYNVVNIDPRVPWETSQQTLKQAIDAFKEAQETKEGEIKEGDEVTISWLHRRGRKHIKPGYYVLKHGGRFVTLALEKPVIHPVNSAIIFYFYIIENSKANLCILFLDKRPHHRFPIRVI